MTTTIYTKYGLIGEDLVLKEDIILTIKNGKIHKINCESKNIRKVDYYFPNHLLFPKFINSHTHVGDSILKDRALGMTLAEAVSPTGIKFATKKFDKQSRIAAMKTAILEMIEQGTGSFCDFREGGLAGLQELGEAMKNLAITVITLGRPVNDFDSEKDSLLSHSDGIGLSTPITFTLDQLTKITKYTHTRNKFIAVHVGEEEEVIKRSFEIFNKSDLVIAVKTMKANIIVHLTHSNRKEMAMIPKKTFLVFCPRSNAYFGLGLPPIDLALDKGYLVGLGTDNVMVSSPSVLDELRWVLLRLLEKGVSINIRNMLKMITVNPSKALQLKTGIIKQNYWADIGVIDLNTVRTRYSTDPLNALIFRAKFPDDLRLNFFRGEEINIK